MGKSPSEYLRIDDEFVGYCIDRAVTVFGIEVESAAEQAVQGAKTRAAADRAYQKVMNKYLYADDPARQMPGRFRDPMAR